MKEDDINVFECQISKGDRAKLQQLLDEGVISKRFFEYVLSKIDERDFKIRVNKGDSLCFENQE